jgi:hypothetical protein
MAAVTPITGATSTDMCLFAVIDKTRAQIVVHV